VRPNTTDRVSVPATAEDLTPAWITAALALGEVQRVHAAAVGTGNMAATVLLTVEWAEPASAPSTFIAKVSSSDPVKRKAAMGWRAYEIESSFYAVLAPTLTGDVPRCYWAGFDAEAGTYAVVLEDLSELTPGDDVDGCNPLEADRALAELALVHGARWDDPELAELSWLNRPPRSQPEALRAAMIEASGKVAATCADRLPAEVLALIERYAATSDRYDRRGFGGPRTVAHGDFRNDNLMFGPGRVCILDWQTVQLGAALADVAYYIGSALSVEDRRAHERDLVHAYHARLRAQGVDLTWNWCWTEYRRHTLSLMATALTAVRGLTSLDERGNRMLLALIERAAYHVLDLDSIDLLAGSS
jgi:hypothetical protein